MLWLDFCIYACCADEVPCCCVCPLLLSLTLPPLGPAADIARFCGLFIGPPVDWPLLKELV